ncbi:hypothetical protein [Haloarchaeobius sp. TZWWS8]|uniref:hypothetical protein n=1 Tax=Haloarchaeobius sp. TZWWS8 TaxID=3446121 RepID=UPI003EBFBCE5
MRSLDVWRRTTTVRNHHHTDVVADPERQYVVAAIVVDRQESAPDDGTTTDGTKTDQLPDASELDVSVRLDGETYADSFPLDVYWSGIGVPVPTGIEPDDGELVVGLPDGAETRFSLSSTQLDRLAHVPRFTLDEFTLEAGNATVQATLTVSNDGDRDGRFLAELGTDSMSDTPEVEIDVPAGETATRTESVPVAVEGSGEVTVVCQWGDESHRRAVTV